MEKGLQTIEKYGAMGCDLYKANPGFAAMAGPFAPHIAKACGLLDTYKTLKTVQRAVLPKKKKRKRK